MPTPFLVAFPRYFNFFLHNFALNTRYFTSAMCCYTTDDMISRLLTCNVCVCSCKNFEMKVFVKWVNDYNCKKLKRVKYNSLALVFTYLVMSVQKTWHNMFTFVFFPVAKCKICVKCFSFVCLLLHSQYCRNFKVLFFCALTKLETIFQQYALIFYSLFTFISLLTCMHGALTLLYDSIINSSLVQKYTCIRRLGWTLRVPIIRGFVIVGYDAKWLPYDIFFLSSLKNIFCNIYVLMSVSPPIATFGNSHQRVKAIKIFIANNMHQTICVLSYTREKCVL